MKKTGSGKSSGGGYDRMREEIHENPEILEQDVMRSLDINPEFMMCMKRRLAQECIKQGYVEAVKDERGNITFQRTKEHAIMEIFDFIVTIKAGAAHQKTN